MLVTLKRGLQLGLSKIIELVTLNIIFSVVCNRSLKQPYLGFLTQIAAYQCLEFNMVLLHVQI